MRLWKLDYIEFLSMKNIFFILYVFELALSFKVWRVYEVFEITAPFVVFV